jgi:archaellum biogenesis protein FlaJ (TadC family)
MKIKIINRRKKKQSSFTTLHGILLSLAVAAFVGLIFVLVVIYYHQPPD